MKRFLPLLALSILLTACGGKTNYDNVPGFKNGKATHPLIKLGSPYDVSGTTYYPEYDPEYSETGMASWYGPGFHGKSTANGERFNANEMTAAHRTLPIPSLVRVTHAKTGRSAIVRINDRGPFAHNRIIDLSKAAAERIGMLGEGVAKVKVEYLPEESRRYISLLEQGRNPSNINVERDVLMGGDTSFADASQTFGSQQKDERTWLDRVNPISSAHAQEPQILASNIQVETKTTSELPALDETPPATLPAPTPATLPAPTPATLPAPTPATLPEPVGQPISGQPVIGTTNVTTRSPFDLIEPQAKIERPLKPEDPPPTPRIATSAGSYVVQLGVYGNEANALSMKERFNDEGNVTVEKIEGARVLYRVRIISLPDEATAIKVRNRVQTDGVSDAKIIKL